MNANNPVSICEDIAKYAKCPDCGTVGSVLFVDNEVVFDDTDSALKPILTVYYECTKCGKDGSIKFVSRPEEYI